MAGTKEMNIVAEVEEEELGTDDEDLEEEEALLLSGTGPLRVRTSMGIVEDVVEGQGAAEVDVDSDYCETDLDIDGLWIC